MKSKCPECKEEQAAMGYITASCRGCGVIFSYKIKAIEESCKIIETDKTEECPTHGPKGLGCFCAENSQSKEQQSDKGAEEFFDSAEMLFSDQKNEYWRSAVIKIMESYALSKVKERKQEIVEALGELEARNTKRPDAWTAGWRKFAEKAINLIQKK